MGEHIQSAYHSPKFHLVNSKYNCLNMREFLSEEINSVLRSKLGNEEPFRLSEKPHRSDTAGVIKTVKVNYVPGSYYSRCFMRIISTHCKAECMILSMCDGETLVCRVAKCSGGGKQSLGLNV